MKVKLVSDKMDIHKKDKFTIGNTYKVYKSFKSNLDNIERIYYEISIDDNGNRPNVLYCSVHFEIV
jgi:hypothetical protein